MKIAVLGLNYAPEVIGIGLYTGGMCRWLAGRGHGVTVVAAKPYYPEWRVFEGWRGDGSRRSVEDSVDVTHVAIYVPAEPTGARRILHHLSSAASAALPLLARTLKQRPDVVITVAPSLIASPVAWAVARLTGAKCWLHVQDFEVEAAFATGLMNQRGIGARLARAFQRFVFRRFDALSSISEEMCRKLESFGVEPARIHQLRNWADLDRVRPSEHPSLYRVEWGIETPHVALYSGNIANKQGIEIVVEAARRLSHRKDLSFVVCGNGPNRAALEREAADLGNMIFRDLQPQDRLGELMGLATVHLLPQKAGAADLVLPSKLTNMLASGRPVVATAAEGTGLARGVEGCGIVTEPGDAAAFAAAIERLLDDEDLRRQRGVTARLRAEKVWSQSAILEGLEARLSALSDRLKPPV